MVLKQSKEPNSHQEAIQDLTLHVGAHLYLSAADRN
jgi:hypothetical protein